jgi:hypothetical protein
MKKIIIVSLILFVASTNSFGQKPDLDKIADSITNEGNILFRSEWASWYGTDIFMDKCKNKQDRIGGYISYDTGKGLNNVFFSKGPDPVVLATTSFGYDFNPANYKLDTIDRKFTVVENELHEMRVAAIKQIGSDTLFHAYKNTELNPVPIIINDTKRVYVLTGTNLAGVVIFGNDYLIEFNDDYTINTVKRLHKNIIPAPFGKSATGNDQIQVGSMHTHLPETGDFITITDVCTLKLYEKFTTWNQYIVTSQHYASIWDCKNNKLNILTIEEWKKSNPLKNALDVSKDH